MRGLRNQSAPGLLLLVLIAIPGFLQSSSTNPDSVYLAFSNGRWFDGHSFQNKTGYAVNGALSFRRPPHVDAVVDLNGGFVVPPFGEAHNHNVESLNKVDALVQRYLQHGIFYVKNPNNLPVS